MYRQDCKANRLLACLLSCLGCTSAASDSLIGSPMQILCSCSQFCVSTILCSISLHHMVVRLSCVSASQALAVISVCLVLTVCLSAAYSPTSPSYSPTSPGEPLLLSVVVRPSPSVIPILMRTLLPIHFCPASVAPILTCISYSGSYTAHTLQSTA